MDSDKIAHLKEIHKDKDTKELMDIWKAGPRAATPEALAAMEFILIDRGEELPHKDREESTHEEIESQRLIDKKKSVDVRKDCEPSESEESLDDALQSGDYKELRKIRKALGKNNEHLQKSNEHLEKIRDYIGWFWWICIGIPITILIFFLIQAIRDDMK